MTMSYSFCLLQGEASMLDGNIVVMLYVSMSLGCRYLFWNGEEGLKLRLYCVEKFSTYSKNGS